MRSVAISLDGVLRKELDTEAKDMGGALLFASLVENFRVVVLGSEKVERDEHFLTINGLIRYVKLEPMRAEDSPTVEGQKRAQVQRLRREGFQFEFVVVPDPVLARDLYSTGVPVMLYLHPLYSAEAFRPDYQGGIQAWNAMVAEVDYQVTTKAEQRAKELTQ